MLHDVSTERVDEVGVATSRYIQLRPESPSPRGPSAILNSSAATPSHGDVHLVLVLNYPATDGEAVSISYRACCADVSEVAYRSGFQFPFSS